MLLSSSSSSSFSLHASAAPLLATSLRCASSSSTSAGAAGSSSSSGGFKSGSIKEEEELVQVLGTQPRHVARRIRQMMAASRRRLSHFRNTVTYLMIVLQGKLQKGEIAPADAAVVVEGVLHECVDLGQSDMAHLLFRAALRFRKYGVPVSPKCVHALYRSFKDHQQQGARNRRNRGDGDASQQQGGNSSNTTSSDAVDGSASSSSSSTAAGSSSAPVGGDTRRGLLAQLASEMKDQPDLRGVTVAAYIYAGQPQEAKRLHASIPVGELTADDFCTMIAAYGNVGAVEEIGAVVDEAVRRTPSPDFDLAAVYSEAIIVCGQEALQEGLRQVYRNRSSGGARGGGDAASSASSTSGKGDLNVAALTDSLFVECLSNNYQPSDAAVGAVMRARLFGTRTLEEALAVESDLRQQLRSDSLGLAATTAFVFRCADFAGTAAVRSDRGMAAKVDQLQQIVTHYIENGDADRIEPGYALALVRGFGALGRFDSMAAALQQLKAHTALVDFKVYDECMRWLCMSGNVKLLLDVKEQMEREHVYHSTMTYVSLLRGLGRYYPRLVHKYIDEARKTLPFFDERLYAQLVSTYTSLGDAAQVRAVYAEMRDRDARGRRCFSPQSVTQLLYSIGQQAAARSTSHNNSNRGGSSNSNSNNSGAGRSDPEAVRLFDSLVELAASRGMISVELVQRAVIAGYAEQRRAADMYRFVGQLPRKSPQIYATLLAACGKLNDPAGFDKMLDEVKSARIPFSDNLFAVAVENCAMWRDEKRFKRVVELSRSAAESVRAGAEASGGNTMLSPKNPGTIARLAKAHDMMGDWDTVVQLWRGLVRNLDSSVEHKVSVADDKTAAASPPTPPTSSARRGGTMSVPMATFNRFLELAVRRNDLAFAHEVLEVMMTRVPANPVTTTTVMDMLGRMGRLHEVEVLLDEMVRSRNIQPTLVTYHHAMAAFAKVGDVNKLLSLRDRIRASGLRENAVTHNILLSGFGRAQRFDAIPDLLNERAAQGIAVDTNCYEILLDVYAKAKMISELENTVQAVLRRTSAGAASSAAAASGDLAAASPSLGGGVGADAEDGASGSDFPEETAELDTVLAGAEHHSLSPRLLAAIATAYSHVADVRNVEKYVTMLLAHPRCQQSHVETAFLIYHRLRDNTKLDWLLAKFGGSEFVLNICISAFAKAGMHDRVAAILHELQDKGWALHTNTAVVLSSLLLKAGKVELAQTVLKFRRVAEERELLRRGGAGSGSGAGGREETGSEFVHEPKSSLTAEVFN